MKKVVTLKLGDLAKDTITGLTGIVVAKTDWLHGCCRITLQPRGLKEGKILDQNTFDEPQLLFVRKNEAKRGSKNTGGPRPEPIQR